MEQNLKPAEEELDQEVSELILSLPKEPKLGLYLYQNFWYRPVFIQGLMSFQRHFESQDQDIIVASYPKSGTTWLKGLVFSIVNRARFPISDSPLLKANPHQLVPFLEKQVYKNRQKDGVHLEHDNVKGIVEPSCPCPRLFGTHVPYTSLPESIKISNSRIVYISRNPLDVIVSFWHFTSGIKDKVTPKFDLSMDEYADWCSRGVSSFGPHWDNVLSYWKESLDNPNKVLFLKYEDMKENVGFHVKRLAEFIGYPFSHEEEESGLVEQIIQLCSFNNMKDLDVNKNGQTKGTVYLHNKVLFRKAEVGDYRNYLSDSRAECIKNIFQEKFSAFGLNLML